MHLGEEHAAGRDGDRSGIAGAQELRRQPGIFGRRNPQVEAGRHCGAAPVEARRQCPHRALAPIGARVYDRQHQEDRQDRSQPPGIVLGQSGNRPADTQAADCGFHPLAMRHPQPCRGAVQRDARLIEQSLEGTMREPASSLDTPPRRHRIAPTRQARPTAQSPGNRRRKRQGQHRQDGDMQPTGQRRKDVEQRQDR